MLSRLTNYLSIKYTGLRHNSFSNGDKFTQLANMATYLRADKAFDSSGNLTQSTKDALNDIFSALNKQSSTLFQTATTRSATTMAVLLATTLNEGEIPRGVRGVNEILSTKGLNISINENFHTKGYFQDVLEFLQGGKHALLTLIEDSQDPQSQGLQKLCFDLKLLTKPFEESEIITLSNSNNVNSEINKYKNLGKPNAFFNQLVITAIKSPNLLSAQEGATSTRAAQIYLKMSKENKGAFYDFISQYYVSHFNALKNSFVITEEAPEKQTLQRNIISSSLHHINRANLDPSGLINDLKLAFISGQTASTEIANLYNTNKDTILGYFTSSNIQIIDQYSALRLRDHLITQIKSNRLIDGDLNIKNLANYAMNEIISQMSSTLTESANKKYGL